VEITLTKRETGRSHTGPVIGTGPVIRYAVNGMPEGETADLADFGGRWRILRTQNGFQGEWTGDYGTADDALAALQKRM